MIVEKKMNIIITGASGFVGTNIRRYLASYGITSIYSLSREQLNDHEEILTDIFTSQRVNVVVHLAAKVHDVKKVVPTDQFLHVNYGLTKKIFNIFHNSNAQKFIFLSSVKASAEVLDGKLFEDADAIPITDYGKSKLLAEQYILSQVIPEDKRVYILRPCMIHGPGNKGNLNLLYKIVLKRIPWILSSFENKRSFCSIDNLMFIIKEIIERKDVPSGIYNISDDEPISTNELICLIAQSQNRKPRFWNIPKWCIKFISALGDKLQLPLNSERLEKLTSSYVVSNAKIKTAIGKPLPVSSREGLLKTFKSFNS